MHSLHWTKSSLNVSVKMSFHRIDGVHVIVSVLASIVVGRGFDSRLGQMRRYVIGIHCFSTKHPMLRCHEQTATAWHGVGIMSAIAVKHLIVEHCFKRDSTYTGRFQHHTTAACGQGKMEQVYTHLLIACKTHKFVWHSNMLVNSNVYSTPPICWFWLVRLQYKLSKALVNSNTFNIKYKYSSLYDTAICWSTVMFTSAHQSVPFD